MEGILAPLLSMKTKSYAQSSHVLFLLLVTLSVGCVHNKSLRVSKMAPGDALVVPVRGQSIIVASENLGLVAVGTLAGGLVGGIAANAANQNSTADKRATLAGRLNADGSSFKPEVILAEECAKLLQASSAKAKFQNVKLHAQPVDLPGRAGLAVDDGEPFKTKVSNGMDWHLRARDWMKTPSSSDYLKLASGGQPVVTVETLFPGVLLLNAKTFEMNVAIRVVDSEGKVLGSQYTAIRRKIRPITRESDFSLFEEDFRRCASEAARECLKDLKLI